MSKTIEIPDEIASQVQELVTSGAYPDTDSALQDAIRLLLQERQRQKLRELIAETDADIARGESDLWSDQLSQRLVREAQEMYRNGMTSGPDFEP